MHIGMWIRCHARTLIARACGRATRITSYNPLSFIPLRSQPCDLQHVKARDAAHFLSAWACSRAAEDSEALCSALERSSFRRVTSACAETSCSCSALTLARSLLSPSSAQGALPVRIFYSHHLHLMLWRSA